MKSRELKKNEALDLEKHALFNLINCQHCIYKMYFCTTYPFKTNLQFLVNKCVGKGLRKMKSRELKTQKKIMNGEDLNFETKRF